MIFDHNICSIIAPKFRFPLVHWGVILIFSFSCFFRVCLCVSVYLCTSYYCHSPYNASMISLLCRATILLRFQNLRCGQWNASGAQKKGQIGVIKTKGVQVRLHPQPWGNCTGGFLHHTRVGLRGELLLTVWGLSPLANPKREIQKMYKRREKGWGSD